MHTSIILGMIQSLNSIAICSVATLIDVYNRRMMNQSINSSNSHNYGARG